MYKVSISIILFVFLLRPIIAYKEVRDLIPSEGVEEHSSSHLHQL